MDYSPFNPLVWGLFMACIAIVWIAVRLFRSAYPEYPGRTGPREQ
jgi:hypothetical protein